MLKLGISSEYANIKSGHPLLYCVAGNTQLQCSRSLYASIRVTNQIWPMQALELGILDYAGIGAGYQF